MKIENIPTYQYIAQKAHFKEPLYGITHINKEEIIKDVISFSTLKQKIQNLEIQLDHKEEWDVIPLNDSDEVQKFLENSNKSIDEIDIDDLAFEQ